MKPTHKGSAVVILNTHDHTTEGIQQLSNKDFYIQPDTDLNHKHNAVVTKQVPWITCFKGMKYQIM